MNTLPRSTFLKSDRAIITVPIVTEQSSYQTEFRANTSAMETLSTHGRAFEHSLSVRYSGRAHQSVPFFEQELTEGFPILPGECRVKKKILLVASVSYNELSGGEMILASDGDEIRQRAKAMLKEASEMAEVHDLAQQLMERAASMERWNEKHKRPRSDWRQKCKLRKEVTVDQTIARKCEAKSNGYEQKLKNFAKR